MADGGASSGGSAGRRTVRAARASRAGAATGRVWPSDSAPPKRLAQSGL